MILFLLAAQLVLTAGGLALIWRRLDGMERELTRLRRFVETRALDRAAPRRARTAETVGAIANAAAAPAWPMGPTQRTPSPFEPPLVIFDETSEPRNWRPSLTPALWLWAGLIAAAGAGGAFFLGQPLIFAAAATLAGIMGLIHAARHDLASGAALTAGAAALLLFAGATQAMISASGAGFTALGAGAALLGASSLRREALHVGAFFALGAGLFALSAQEAAAIWFTPASAIFGALFFAIATVRIPVLGARGAVLAGTATAAAMFGVGALHVSQHGLASNGAASAAFAVLAASFAALISVAARRRSSGLAGLGMTLWVLAFGLMSALASAVFLVSPPPLAAALMAGAALGFAGIDARWPNATWRAGAVAALALAAGAAWTSAQAFLAPAGDWPRSALFVLGAGAPTMLAMAAIVVARRSRNETARRIFEAFALAGGLGCAALTLRFVFSGGEPSRFPVGFIEAGAHVAIWLIAALLLTARRRPALAASVFAPAFTAGALAGLLWLTPFWLERPLSGLTFLDHAPLGFAFMAAPAGALWLHWRAAAAQARARTAFIAAAFAIAAFITLEVVWARRDWGGASVDLVKYGAGFAAFAGALVASLAPALHEKRA